MASSITHLVVGERVFKQVTYLDPTLAAYGTFLAGCILVDVHAFHDISRRKTHFVGRVDEDGEDAYRKSCSNFLSQLDTLLQHSWNDMTQTDQAFVTGYLCHLAADECWKELGWHSFQKLNITSWTEFPVPPDVSLTAFDFLSQGIMIDSATAFAALQAASIPDVFRHIPHRLFCHQWDIIQDYVWSGGTPESYVTMLEYAGKPHDKIQEAKQQHAVYWKDAIEFVHSIGGVLPFIQNAGARAVHVIPEGWLNPMANNAV